MTKPNAKPDPAGLRCRIEPAAQYDRALVIKSGRLYYDYQKLIAVTQDLHQCSEDDAQDWVDYNICCLPSIKITNTR
jgi:hypothetical protein